MSYNLEGKLVNQKCRKRLNPAHGLHVRCEKCSKVMAAPEMKLIHLNDRAFSIESYAGTNHFIYETKLGKSVVYCSAYCRNKHNHRFSERK